ncbi:hypothetical protein [Haloferula sargassicola]|uniref:DUF349 domain-containing protein n=1 Tax=Haloferula sargassicola TaxID=490096 RepID=A0ABP9ULP7_9BACT
MKACSLPCIGLAAILASSCAQQRVSESVVEHTAVEGRRYAAEVKAQSPFETVELKWSEAENLMKTRNRDYLKAKADFAQATEEKPVVRELTDEVKGAVDLSLGDALKPDALIASLRTPATQLPKQLASISKLKDISHQMEQSAWDQTARSVDAEMRMREEKVKLHRLLRLGALIDAELAKVNASPPPPQDADPKLVKAVDQWRGTLRDERRKWLGDVRNFFDAEYHDVHVVKDEPGLPTYEHTTHPDLTEWQRWCRLRRSIELVNALKKAHDSDKPAIPGTRMVQEKFDEILHPDEPQVLATLDDESVRKEVRSLIQHWREMKQAQQEANGLEQQAEPDKLDDVTRVDRRQKIFKLRQQEIQHASEVWAMDELCWR